VALLFLLKIAASIVSLGSGFRGGMFFSPLPMGALGGELVAVAPAMIDIGIFVVSVIISKIRVWLARRQRRS